MSKRDVSERDAAIRQAAAEERVDRLVELLQSVVHHGKPGASGREVELAAEGLQAKWEGNALRLGQAVRGLAALEAASARKLACLLVAPLWLEGLSYTPLVLDLAADADWEVREWAVHPIATLLSSDFPRGVERVRELAANRDPAVRRQVVVAVKAVAHRRIRDSRPL